MLYQEYMLENQDELNAGLLARFREVSGTDRIRQSHHFGGRFENTYIKTTDMPEMDVLLAAVKQQAAQLLGRGAAALRAGFWFNAMGPGHVTSLHHHDENDELLSAVYYIRVPGNSGDLVLHDADRVLTIKPQEGKLVLFAPDVLHEVTENRSPELRLSVAFNIGPVEN